MCLLLSLPLVSFSGKWWWGGGGVLATTKTFPACSKTCWKKNRERGATRKETEQVLSTIQGMLFDLKKFLAQAITYQKTHAQGP